MTKTPQACIACRETKRKCCDVKPCSACKQRNIECLWEPPPLVICPGSFSGTILSTLQTVHERQQIILQMLDTIERKEAIEQAKSHAKVKMALTTCDPSAKTNCISEYGVGNGLIQGHSALSWQTTHQGHNQPGLLSWQDDGEITTALRPGEPAIPEGHTAATARLLLWPAVGKFIREIEMLKHEDMELFVEYPNKKEGKNGLAHIVESEGCHNSQTDRDGRFSNTIGPRSLDWYEAQYKNNTNKQLGLDTGTVHRLVTNYVSHIHAVHPILDPAELYAHWDKSLNKAILGQKRTQTSFGHILRPQRLEFSIGDAIFFLVLALGKVFDRPDRASNLARNQGSISWSSPQIQDRHRDDIPGLSYALQATKILGNEVGESSLQHVQASILASLYFGQLSLPSYCHRHTNNASLGLQILLRLKLARLRIYRVNILAKASPLPAIYNPLVFAFWTCLQLESDIIAELDLPHSGITTLEENMPWPNFEAAVIMKILTPIQAESYQAQLYLRNHLNTIHKKVYGVGEKGQFLEEEYKLSYVNSRFPVIEALAESIPDMSIIAPLMVQSDSEGSGNDALVLQLRARYHYAQALTYRPFLKMVMNRHWYIGSPPEGAISREVFGYAKMCIQAMENSTSAFHKIQSGPLFFVTNVWTAAHTQWGNVILLQVAYQDPLLRPFIDKEKLRILVLQTLRYLRQAAGQKSALMTDIQILEFTAQKMSFWEDSIME